MAEQEQVSQIPHEGEIHHGHRKRRKRRSWKQRVLRATLVFLFFAAWGFGVWKWTQYLGDKDELGKQYHAVDPSGFKEGVKPR